MSYLDRAVAAARARYREANPTSRAWHEQATAVMPGGNTRSVLDFEPFPFRVVEVDGPELVDADGHRYVDMLGNYSAGLLGHRPEPIRVAVAAALERGWSAGAVRPVEVELARLVCERFPGIERVRFTNSGTEANLMAIAAAKHLTGRSQVLAFDHAYHGGVLHFGDGGRDLLVPHDWVTARFNDLASVAAVFEAPGSDIAAVIVEPMMAASGCVPGTRAFLAGLRELTGRWGSLLIFDEVMTSRLAWGGIQQLLGFTADLTTLGKYLAGGLTFGAFGGSARVMACFDPAQGGSLSHGGTFNNNELSGAAGVAALTEMLTPDRLAEVNDRGDRLRSDLAVALGTSGLPMCVTGLGSLMTIHATAGPVSSPADLGAADDRLKELLFFDLLDRGFYLARRGFIALSLDVTDDHVDRFVAAVSEWAERVASRVDPAPVGGLPAGRDLRSR